VDEAKVMIGSSGLKILPVDNLDEAARYYKQRDKLGRCLPNSVAGSGTGLDFRSSLKYPYSAAKSELVAAAFNAHCVDKFPSSFMSRHGKYRYRRYRYLTGTCHIFFTVFQKNKIDYPPEYYCAG
jgi:hypothetical protein